MSLMWQNIFVLGLNGSKGSQEETDTLKMIKVNFTLNFTWIITIGEIICNSLDYSRIIGINKIEKHLDVYQMLGKELFSMNLSSILKFAKALD